MHSVTSSINSAKFLLQEGSKIVEAHNELPKDNSQAELIKVLLNHKLQELSRCQDRTKELQQESTTQETTSRENNRIFEKMSDVDQYLSGLDKEILRSKQIGIAEKKDIPNNSQQMKEYSKRTYEAFIRNKKLDAVAPYVRQIHSIAASKNIDLKPKKLLIEDSIADAHIKMYNLEIEKIIYIQMSIALKTDKQKFKSLKKERTEELNKQQEQDAKKLNYFKINCFPGTNILTSLPGTAENLIIKTPSEKNMKSLSKRNGVPKRINLKDILVYKKYLVYSDKLAFLNKHVKNLIGQLKTFVPNYQKKETKSTTSSTPPPSPRKKETESTTSSTPPPSPRKIEKTGGLSISDFIVYGLIALSAITLTYYAIKYALPKMRTWVTT